MGSPRDLRRCSIRAHARRPRNHHDRQPFELAVTGLVAVHSIQQMVLMPDLVKLESLLTACDLPAAQLQLLRLKLTAWPTQKSVEQ